MTAVDLLILLFVVLMVIWGYRQGLIVGALSLAGFAVGAFAGSRLGPLLLSQGSGSPYAPLFALIGAFLLGGVLATGLEGFGFRLRRRLGSELGALDGVGGSVLLGCLGLGLAWIIGAVVLQLPNTAQLHQAVQRSAILGALNSDLPPSGPVLNALSRFDPFPRIAGPTPGVAEPDQQAVQSPKVNAARRSVVRVLGTACGLGIEGSGWVAGDGEVVTNAHVVAGESDTTVQLGGRGSHYDATPIWFDPLNDIAILRVRALSGTPALATHPDAPVGTSAAILGFPEDGPYDVEPGRLGDTVTIQSQDAYGHGPVTRKVTALRGLVRMGNSGGPMVDANGGVVTTIFASTLGGGQQTGLGVPDSLVRQALSSAHSPVSTGPCAG